MAPTEETDPTSDPLYTIREAAALLRLYHKSVYRLCDAGKIGFVRVGRKKLIPASAVAEYIKKH